MKYRMKSSGLLLLICSVVVVGCKGTSAIPEDLDAKEEMREFVMAISQSARRVNPEFVVIPQNGIELVTEDGESDGQPHMAYLSAIDGHGQEDLLYGYNRDDRATPSGTQEYLRSYLDISREAGNHILVTDYCSTEGNMADSYRRNQEYGYISFAANHRELDIIPGYPAPIHEEHAGEVESLSDVRNFLYLLNPENFGSRQDFIAAVSTTNYDLVIMDLFFQGEEVFTSDDLNQLRRKANGGRRLLICYLSIGEAEDYRYYWDEAWGQEPPEWLDRENPNWQGNFKVHYWNPEWQAVIYGNQNAYLTKILEVGFDGVYLDIIDAFEYYE